jgi:hypothetical protein
MQNPRFLVLTGHLNDYPLPDLVGILRHQRKTGRLLIEYPNGPAAFYFQEGELVDAQVDKLSGLQAVCVALAQPGSPFNFNPLIAPTRRSIENSLQRVVSELLGCWEESPLQIETAVSERSLPRSEPLAIPASTSADSEIKALDVLTLPTLNPPAASYSRVILAMAAAGLMMLGLSTVIAVTGGFKGRAESAKRAPVPSETTPRAAQVSSQETGSTARLIEPRKITTEQNDGLKARGGSSAVFRSAQKAREEVAKVPPSVSSPAATSESTETMRNDEVNVSVRSVDVVMQIEHGRVLRASIANPRKGMDGYEALALRIARQRRYPAKKSGQETVRIQVSPPD